MLPNFLIHTEQIANLQSSLQMCFVWLIEHIRILQISGQNLKDWLFPVNIHIFGFSWKIRRLSNTEFDFGVVMVSWSWVASVPLDGLSSSVCQSSHLTGWNYTWPPSFIYITSLPTCLVPLSSWVCYSCPRILCPLMGCPEMHMAGYLKLWILRINKINVKSCSWI